MNANSEKFKEEWAFFISPTTNKIQYNAQCKNCKNDCKQSFRAEIVYCPIFEKEEQKNA